jgi:hypothetical protein
MAVTLTPGTESRLEGAPGVDLFADDLENRTQFWISQGADPQEARQLAAEDVAKMRDRRAREAEVASARAAREAQRATARMPDQRPIPVQEADLEWRQDLADQQTREYRQSGMQWAPDSAGQQAQDMQRAITPSAGTSDPFVPTQFDPKDPIKDDRAVAADFQRFRGRPPRSRTELENHRRHMIFLYRSRNNTRPTSQAPGRWGHRGHSFVSPEEERAYSDHGPGRPSPMMQDMYTGGAPFVLRQQEDGMSGPARAAPAPVPGQPFQVYDPVSGTYHLFKSDEGMDSVMVGGNEVPLGPGTSNEAFGGQETAPVRRLDLERSEDHGGPGYVPTLVQGPAGPEWVYVQTQKKRDRVKEETQERQNEQMVDRLAEKAGISYEDAEKMAATPEGMKELRREARRGYQSQKQEQVADARRMRSENARMNSGQLGLQMQQMDPDFRQVMLLDRLTQGRQGGATPFDVQAVGARNALQYMMNEAIGARERNPEIELKREQLAQVQREQKFEAAAELISSYSGGTKWWNYTMDNAEKRKVARTLTARFGGTVEENLQFVENMQALYKDEEGDDDGGGGTTAPATKPGNRVPVPQGSGRGGTRKPAPPTPPARGRGGSGNLPRSR